MADIQLDIPNSTILAILTPIEFAIVSAVVAEAGTDGLQNLFASFIQQHGAEQRARRREELRKAIDFLTDAQLTEMKAVISK